MERLSDKLHPILSQINERRKEEKATGVCQFCNDTGMMAFSTGEIPCQVCEKGKAIEFDRQHSEWFGRAEHECGIPPALRQAVHGLEYDDTIRQQVYSSLELHRGAYLHGGVGRGKSVAACAVLLDALGSHRDIGRSPRTVGYFTTVSDWLQSIRNSFDSGNAGTISGREPEGRHTGGYCGITRLCVLDDIGSERLTDWGAEQLCSLINERMEAGKPTVYTSNYSPEELEQRINRQVPVMGDRIVSRILGSCDVIPVTGPDYRRTHDQARRTLRNS